MAVLHNSILRRSRLASSTVRFSLGSVFNLEIFCQQNFICADRRINRQTVRQMDKQTDEHPQTSSENMPDGKPYGYLAAARFESPYISFIQGNNWVLLWSVSTM